MRLLRTSFLVFLCSSFSWTNALAGSVNLHGNFLYFSQSSEAKDSGVQVESSTSHKLLRGGGCYFVDQSWCLGLDLLLLTISNESDAASSVLSANSEAATTWSGTGASLAYVAKPWFVNGTYFFSGERESVNETLITDVAWMLEAGYAMEVRGISVGPLLSYVVFDYDEIKTTSGTDPIDGSRSDSFILPSIALWINL